MTDEELWLKHIEEYPQIKLWSAEKREGARKGFKSGLAEGRKENEELKAQVETLSKRIMEMAENWNKLVDKDRENFNNIIQYEKMIEMWKL